MNQSLRGRLRDLTLFGEWGRGSVITESEGTVSVVGKPLAGLQRLRTYEFTGEVVVHPTYGEQFRVNSARLFDQVDRDRILAALETEFSGIGAKTAMRVVATYEARGEGLGALADLLDTTPWELEADEEATGKRVTHLESHGKSLQQRLEQSIQVRATFDIGRDAVAAIAGWAAQAGADLAKSLSLLRTDPWSAGLAQPWLRFNALDAVAAGFRADPRAMSRACAAMAFLVHDICQQEGHTGVPKDRLREALSAVIGALPAEVDRIADEALGRGYRLERSRKAVFEASHLAAERLCARALRSIAADRMPLWLRERRELDCRLSELQAEMGVQLDPDQAWALRLILLDGRGLHTLRAGPGAGKTLMMELIAALIPESEFAAPTGKAARVLGGRLKNHRKTASTVHGLLESSPSAFRRNRHNPLQARLVVVDEAGMLDVHTFQALLDAVAMNTHVLLVGDPDQLESVGPGNVFTSVLAFEKANHQVLRGQHRNEGDIARFVAGLRRGAVLQDLSDGSVCLIHPPPNPRDAVERVLGVWRDSVSERGAENVGLILSTRKGSAERPGLNVTHLNARAQAMMNPPRTATQLPGTHVRVGDRVIVRRNLAFLEPGGSELTRLVNGDTGIVAERLRRGDASRDRGGAAEHFDVLLRLDSGQQVHLPGEHLRVLELGYALTCHAAQGSEFAHAIVILEGQATAFNSRRLVYTACSRAKSLLTVVAAPNDLKAMAAMVTPARYSHLQEVFAAAEQPDRAETTSEQAG